MLAVESNVVRLPGAPEVRQFVQYPADIADALFAANLGGNEFKLAMALLRQTHGYRKAADDTTISRLATVAGIGRPRASEAFNRLLALKIVFAHKGKFGLVMGFTPVRFWLGLDADFVARLAGDVAADEGDSDASENSTPVPKADGRPFQNGTHNIEPKYKTTPHSPPTGDGAAAGDGDQVAEADVSSAEKSGGKRQRGKVPMRQWLELCQANGEKPLPSGHAVFSDAMALGIDPLWLRLAWVDFKQRYCTDPNYQRKRQADWPGYFHQAVRECWCGYWFIPDGSDVMQLTSRGRMRVELAQRNGELGG